MKGTEVKPQTFRKKPVNVETMTFTSWGSALAIFDWSEGNAFYVPEGFEHSLRRKEEHDHGTGNIRDEAAAFLVIRTLEGDMRADWGDVIIRGVNGEFYPCKPDIFKATYEEV